MYSPSSRKHDDTTCGSSFHSTFAQYSCSTRILLQQCIFASTLQAKTRFLEILQVSPARSAERSASEMDGAQSEADAIKHAAKGRRTKRIAASNDARAEGKGRRERHRFGSPDSSHPKVPFLTCPRRPRDRCIHKSTS